MDEQSVLRAEIKKMLVDNLMLQIKAEEIGDDQALFGPGSLALDSVDALQLVVALDKNYGIKVPDPESAKKILHSVNSMAEAVQQKRNAQ
jgi:acyl carrier protein